MCEMK